MTIAAAIGFVVGIVMIIAWTFPVIGERWARVFVFGVVLCVLSAILAFVSVIAELL